MATMKKAPIRKQPVNTNPAAGSKPQGIPTAKVAGNFSKASVTNAGAVKKGIGGKK